MNIALAFKTILLLCFLLPHCYSMEHSGKPSAGILRESSSDSLYQELYDLHQARHKELKPYSQEDRKRIHALHTALLPKGLHLHDLSKATVKQPLLIHYEAFLPTQEKPLPVFPLVSNVHAVFFASLINKDSINTSDEHKEQPLHYATQAGNPFKLLLLVLAGADINTQTHLGSTPLTLVTKYETCSIGGLYHYRSTPCECPFYWCIKILLSAGSQYTLADRNGKKPFEYFKGNYPHKNSILKYLTKNQAHQEKLDCARTELIKLLQQERALIQTHLRSGIKSKLTFLGLLPQELAVTLAQYVIPSLPYPYAIEEGVASQAAKLLKLSCYPLWLINAVEKWKKKHMQDT